ncbi:hypothetical protein NJB1728e24_19560, partial [Mycobacterium marinum]
MAAGCVPVSWHVRCPGERRSTRAVSAAPASDPAAIGTLAGHPARHAAPAPSGRTHRDATASTNLSATSTQTGHRPRRPPT